MFFFKYSIYKQIINHRHYPHIPRQICEKKAIGSTVNAGRFNLPLQQPSWAAEVSIDIFIRVRAICAWKAVERKKIRNRGPWNRGLYFSQKSFFLKPNIRDLNEHVNAVFIEKSEFFLKSPCSLQKPLVFVKICILII